MPRKLRPASSSMALAKLEAATTMTAPVMPAHHTCYVHPHRKADGDKHLPEAFAQGEGNGYDQQHGGDGPHHVDEPGDEVVHPSSVVGGHRTQGDAYKQGYEQGYEAD